MNAPDLLHRVRLELASFDGPIDAIAGYGDFPVSTLVAPLGKE
ncbi:hypothetical protein AB0D38_46420 [Streptomyces sp. NPDC048279]